MNTIKELWIITKKDLIEFARDRLRLVTFFIMPLFMMIMTGYIFPDQNSLKNIPIGLVNQDSEIGQELAETITNLKISDNQVFDVKNYSSEDEIIDAIKKQEISGGLVIPPHEIPGTQTQVTIIEDQANPQVSSLVTQSLKGIIDKFDEQMSLQTVGVLVQGTDGPTAAWYVKPIQTLTKGILPDNPNYFEFVAPGIIAMIVMTAVLTGLAASISREKEQGTLDGILISPVSRLAIILGKALAQAVRGLIQGAIVLLLAWVLFGVTINGNLLLVILILLLGIFSFVGLGILVSAMATEQETATQLLFMFQFPMLFLSGTFFPILMMPEFMQKISYVIPLTYAINALRKVMVLGAGFSQIQTEFWILLVFGFVTLSISVPVFKRVITK